MKTRFRLFRRARGVFYIEDSATLRQESLKTKDKTAAQRLFQAKNASHEQPALNLQLARTYLAAGDPKRQWPAIEFKPKRAITFAEHADIVEREGNREKKAFYELLWHLGGSQGDMANLMAEDVDWTNQVISYRRQKTDQAAQLHFGDQVARVLRALPSSGPLFPYLRTLRAADRATEFKQRCRGLGILGVTLHSYRYAWAERAKAAGYPERFAMEALGHNSMAVHRAYAKNAQVKLPALEEYEKAALKRKVIPLPTWEAEAQGVKVAR